jgi:multimeric flavodoxin WrbA
MLKRVLAFNGSGRKNWNTAQLASKFIEGATSAGASGELVHLGDLKFQGCQGCLSCKLIGPPQYTHCVLKDDLTKYLNAFETYDVVAFASPLFFMVESAMLRACLERILFPYLDNVRSTPAAVLSKYRGKAKIAYLATMNIGQEGLDKMLQSGSASVSTQDYLRIMFGNCTPLFAVDTLQAPSSATYQIKVTDEIRKRARHESQFPTDLQKAYDLGARLVRESQ